MNWYLEVLKKYAVFEGRARRKEYWMFLLINLLVSIAIGVVDAVVFGAQSWLSVIYSLAVILPGLAVTARRLHDTDRSGWWILIAVIPLIGPIVLLVFTVQDSKPGDNAYGANPKAALA